jgi:hypothetical protein
MEPLYISGTDTCPTIVLNPVEQLYLIEGKSVPVNGNEYFEPVIKWFENFSPKKEVEISFKINLEYFNISSSKMLLFILYKLNDLRAEGYQVNVDWYYSCEDDDMYEVGEDFAFMVDVPFNFILDTKRNRQTA